MAHARLIRPSPMKELGLLAAGIAAATTSLWTLDVLINLSPVEALFLDESRTARPRDFLGVMLADAVAGTLLAGMAAIGAGLLCGMTRGLRVPAVRHAGWRHLFVAMLPALLVGAAIYSVLGPLWRGESALKLAVGWGSVAAAISFLLMQRIRNDPADPGAEPSSLLRRSFHLPLLVGSSAAVSCPVPHPGRWSAAVVLLLGLSLLVALSRRRSPSRRTSWWVAALPGLALAFAAAMVARSALHGASPAGGVDARAPPSGRTPPSIVLVVLDTVRADHLDLYGYERPTMPQLAAWSRSALVFERAMSPGGWTAPAHASLFSGLTVSQHGVHFGAGSQFWTPPVDGIDWLPAQLAARGYDTLAIVSNPLSLPADNLGFARRFQPARKTWHDNDTIAVSVDNNLELPVLSRWSAWLRWRDPHVTADGVITIARRALRRAPTSTPLFLFLNFMEAHGPYNPTPAALNDLNVEQPSAAHRYRLPARIGKQQLPPRDIADFTDLYDAELRSLDSHLGPFLEEIVARLGTETVVVVTADHGEELGEEGRYDHLYGVVQRLVHVPLIVRDPRLPSGRRPELTSTRNLYRYLLGVADGDHDLDPLVNADGDDVISERYPSGRYQRLLGPEYGRPWVALFAGTLKAVGPSSAGRELYRLDSRYRRERRLVESPTTAELFERLDRYWEEQRDRRGNTDQEHDREELERLRALGYID